MIFMVEKYVRFTVTNEKTIEKVIDQDLVAINHMVLPQGDSLPEHYANSNVFMVVARGTVTLRLDEQEDHKYEAGNILQIPYKTKMNVSNKDPQVLELFVVKAPGPSAMN